MSGQIKMTVDSVFDLMSDGQKQHMANKLVKHGTIPQNLPSSSVRTRDLSPQEMTNRLRDYVGTNSVRAQLVASDLGEDAVKLLADGVESEVSIEKAVDVLNKFVETCSTNEEMRILSLIDSYTLVRLIGTLHMNGKSED